MKKVQIEFINTCPCCDEHTRTVQEAAKRYGDQVEAQIYYTGKDFGYLKKYGMVTKGTLIINGCKKIENLSKSIIEEAIESAVRSCES